MSSSQEPGGTAPGAFQPSEETFRHGRMTARSGHAAPVEPPSDEHAAPQGTSHRARVAAEGAIRRGTVLDHLRNERRERSGGGE